MGAGYTEPRRQRQTDHQDRQDSFHFLDKFHYRLPCHSMVT
jgi:hypothetical protein